MNEKLAAGLDLLRNGDFFEAHEVFEELWRAAPTEDRDFYQGLVHVAVAWHQADRRNRTGCERQLEKARRRLAPYAPTYAGVDVAAILAVVDDASTATGSLELPPLSI